MTAKFDPNNRSKTTEEKLNELIDRLSDQHAAKPATDKKVKDSAKRLRQG